MATVRKRYGTSRKPVQQDLQAAEEVQEKLEGFWLVLQQYRYPLFGGIGALFVLVSILSIVESVSESGKMEANASLNAVLEAAKAPVFAEEKPEGFEGKSFASEGDRAKAVAAAAGTLENDEMKALASLAVSPAHFAAGDFKAAAEATAAGQTAFGDSPLAGVLALRSAVVAQASGDTSTAQAGYTQAVNSDQPYLQIQGLKGLGDLSNPSMGGNGDAASSKSQYEKALALVDQVQDQDTKDALKAELEGRIQGL